MAVTQLHLKTPTPAHPGGTVAAGVTTPWFMAHSGSIAAIALGVALSLTPGVLPRAWPMQAVVTALFVVAALVLLAGGRRFRCGFAPLAGAAAAGISVFAALGALWFNWSWQNLLRTEMGMPTIGVTHWTLTAVTAAALTGLVVITARNVSRVFVPLRRGVVATIASVAVVYTFVLPLGNTVATRSVQPAGLAIPASVAGNPSLAGSTASLVRWNELGSHGQRFVSDATTSVRVYAGPLSAATVDDRARLVGAELERAGGLRKEHLVLAFPTGSGWLDANALDAMEARFGPDLAIAAMAYSQRPSWMSYLFGRSEAEAAAVAFAREISHQIRNIPADDRPNIYLYGLSMGAVAGASALAALTGFAPEIETCGALWAGAPPGVDRTTVRTALVDNPTDPVTLWQPNLLFQPAPELHVWLPVISYLQVSADLANSLAASPGFGHRYGSEQGSMLPGC